MLYKKNEKMLKNDNQYTINVNDNVAALIDKLASYYNRKPAEFLRIILLPILSDEYSKIMTIVHPENKSALEEARFNG